MQVPQLRLVVGDILRQDLRQLLADMQTHPQQLQDKQQEQQQPAEAASAQQGQADGAGPQPSQQQPPAAQAQAANQQQQEGQQAQPWRRVKVVANLPYYITKDCLVAMLPLGEHISALYFMLQASGRVGGCWS